MFKAVLKLCATFEHTKPTLAKTACANAITAFIANIAITERAYDWLSCESLKRISDDKNSHHCHH